MRWRRFRFVLDFLINESLCGEWREDTGNDTYLSMH